MTVQFPSCKTPSRRRAEGCTQMHRPHAGISTFPLIGSLLDDGYGTEVFLALAAVVALAGILNLRPVEGSLEPEA